VEDRRGVARIALNLNLRKHVGNMKLFYLIDDQVRWPAFCWLVLNLLFLISVN
jgi:hypothetical protein